MRVIHHGGKHTVSSKGNLYRIYTIHEISPDVPFRYKKLWYMKTNYGQTFRQIDKDKNMINHTVVEYTFEQPNAKVAVLFKKNVGR